MNEVMNLARMLMCEELDVVQLSVRPALFDVALFLRNILRKT